MTASIKSIFKEHVAPPTLFLILAAPMLWFLGGEFFSVWDINIPPLNPAFQSDRYSFLWDSGIVGGKPNSFMWTLPLVWATKYLTPWFTAGWASTLIFYFHTALAGITFYYMMRHFMPNSMRSRSLAAVIGAIAYMLNKFWVLRGSYYFNSVFILAYLPLMVVLLDNIIFAKTFRTSAKYCLLTALVSLPMIPGLSNMPAMAATFVFLMFFTLALVFLKGTKLKRTLARLMFLLVLIAPLHGFWLIHNVYSESFLEAVERKGTYLNDTLSSLKFQSDRELTGYSNILSSRGYWLWTKDKEFSGKNVNAIRYTNVHNNQGMIALAFVPLGLVFLGLFGTKFRMIKATKATLIAMVLFCPVYALLRPPFGWLVEWSAINLPFFVFRRPPSYMFIFEFVVAMLLAFAVLRVLNSHWTRIGKTVFAAVAIVAVMILGFQRLTGQPMHFNAFSPYEIEMKRVSGRFNVPEYVHNLAEYLNAAPKEGGVLILPLVPGVRIYDWSAETAGYMGLDIYHFYVKRPIIAHYNARETLYEYMKRTKELLDAGETTHFRNVMRRLGVRYVILQYDNLESPWRELMAFNQGQYEMALAHSGAKRVKRFGHHVLYEFPETGSQFFFPKHWDVVQGANKQQLITYSIRDHNDFLLLDSLPEGDVESLLEGQLVSKVESWSQKTPTHLTVSMKQALPKKRQAAILATRMFDHPGWVASLEGQPNRPLKKVKVNGFFQGIIIPHDAWGESGTCTINFEFKPQQIQAASYALAKDLVVLYILLIVLDILVIENLLRWRKKHSSDKRLTLPKSVVNASILVGCLFVGLGGLELFARLDGFAWLHGYMAERNQTSLTAGISEPMAGGYFPDGSKRLINQGCLGEGDTTGVTAEQVIEDYEQHKDERRILVMGDSFTKGHGLIRPKQSFPNRLADKLPPGNHLLQLSHCGFTAWEEWQYFDNIGKLYQPSILLLGVYLNDIIPPHPYKPRRMGSNEIKNLLLNKKYLEGGSFKTLLDLRMKGLPFMFINKPLEMHLRNTVNKDFLEFMYANPSYMAEMDRSYEGFAKYARETGAEVYCALFPTFPETKTWDDHVALRIYGLLRDKLENYGFKVISLLDTYKPYQPIGLRFTDDAHPNRLAHRLAADAVFQRLESDGMLEPE